jgi:hypothetical protein
MLTRHRRITEPHSQHGTDWPFATASSGISNVANHTTNIFQYCPYLLNLFHRRKLIHDSMHCNASCTTRLVSAINEHEHGWGMENECTLSCLTVLVSFFILVRLYTAVHVRVSALPLGHSCIRTWSNSRSKEIRVVWTAFSALRTWTGFTLPFGSRPKKFNSYQNGRSSVPKRR